MSHIFHELWPVSEPRILAIYSWQGDWRGGWNSLFWFMSLGEGTVTARQCDFRLSVNNTCDKDVYSFGPIRCNSQVQERRWQNTARNYGWRPLLTHLFLEMSRGRRTLWGAVTSFIWDLSALANILCFCFFFSVLISKIFAWFVSIFFSLCHAHAFIALCIIWMLHRPLAAVTKPAERIQIGLTFVLHFSCRKWFVQSTE